MNEISNCNLVAIASSLAIAISKNATTDELNILAAFFTALGDNLAILALSTDNTNEKNTTC